MGQGESRTRDAPDPDAELVRQARAELPYGTTAYRRLVERHADAIYRRAYRMLGTREDAEDAVQDVMLSVFRGLPRLRPEKPFAHWLGRVTTNACLLILRRRAQQSRRRDAIAREPEAESGSSGDPILREALARALEAFPEDTQLAVVGRLLEGRSYADLARELGIGESAVKMRVSRASVALRKQLAGPAMEGDADGG